MLGGAAAALTTSLMVAFIVAYAYGAYASAAAGDTTRFVAATLSGDMEAWRVVFAVFVVALVIAIPMALLTLIFLAIPFILLSLRRGWTSAWAYGMAGASISVIDMGLFALEQRLSPYRLMAIDFHFALAGIVLSGPVAMLVLWIIVRPAQLSSGPPEQARVQQ